MSDVEDVCLIECEDGDPDRPLPRVCYDLLDTVDLDDWED